ncbi:MAG: bifunctional phosphoribosylaminoimidazolecarboxamide formyltransferase/IMP cyclohydrolase [bacterium]
MIKRALISVSDKKNIHSFTEELSKLGIEIVSTGGTRRYLSENGINTIPIEEVTGFPQMMDGRVKTLHPKIHGAILGLRDSKDHALQAEKHQIQWIDLVVVNLYPFESVIQKDNIGIEEAIENIDIGGPTMLRSAAKNYAYVTVVTDVSDYDPVLREIRDTGEVSLDTRKKLAIKVFRRAAAYDVCIDNYLSEKLLSEKTIHMHFNKGLNLRYGENRHQQAVFYRDVKSEESSVARAEIIHGKKMSYNNYVDSDAALEAVKELNGDTGVAVIKHTNPCGYAIGKTPGEALKRAWAGDPVSSFGSVIACNKKVDLEFAEFLKGKNIEHTGYIIQGEKLIAQKVPKKFVEVIIAPDYEEDALKLLSRTKSLRLLKTGELYSNQRDKKTFRKITGGLLEMDKDLSLMEKFDIVTKAQFSKDKKNLADFTYKACKHTKSNAIVLGREYAPGYYQIIGMGAGQPNRVDSLRKLAVTKAKENLQIEYDVLKPDKSFDEYCNEQFSQMVLASDAFFPFDDTVRVADEFDIKFIIQPGGSKRDDDSINLCNEKGISMAFTGMRHFRH